MIEQAVVPYGFERRLRRATFDQTVEQVTAALKKEGFGVLTQIDVKDALKNALNADFRPYVILGACNPVLAYEALSAEPQIGLLLPCNVVVQEAPEGGILRLDRRTARDVHAGRQPQALAGRRGSGSPDSARPGVTELRASCSVS